MQRICLLSPLLQARSKNRDADARRLPPPGMPGSNRTWRPSERARDAAEAALEAELASLSHTSTLIIQHDESTATVDATRDHEVQLLTIEAHREGFSLVADSNSDRTPADADARARGSPTLHLNLSITNPVLGCHQPGGGGTEGRGGGSNGGGSNSPSTSGDDVDSSSSRKEEEELGRMQDGPTEPEPACERRRRRGGRSVLLTSLGAAEASERAVHAQQECVQAQARTYPPHPPDPTGAAPRPITPHHPPHPICTPHTSNPTPHPPLQPPTPLIPYALPLTFASATPMPPTHLPTTTCTSTSISSTSTSTSTN